MHGCVTVAQLHPQLIINFRLNFPLPFQENAVPGNEGEDTAQPEHQKEAEQLRYFETVPEDVLFVVLHHLPDYPFGEGALGKIHPKYVLTLV